MDTSKEYIAMCKAANEIQKVWEPEIGDFTDRGIVNATGLGTVDGDEIFELSGKDFIGIDLIKLRMWLPRQDQLQEMLKHKFIGCKSMLLNFTEYIHNNCDFNDSLEGFWLRYVMLLEYNKTWNGTKWVKS